VLTLKVINLWAGPGAGKSTLAAGLFNLMKNMQHEVELVTEFAKDVTWEKNYGTLQNQLVVLAEQDRRLRRLEGQVEWAITDSPLPIGLVYMTPEYNFLHDAMPSIFGRYRNYHALVCRDPNRPYHEAGRNQTLDEATQLDRAILDLYEAYSLGDPTMDVFSDHRAPYEVYEEFVDVGQ